MMSMISRYLSGVDNDWQVHNGHHQKLSNALSVTVGMSVMAINKETKSVKGLATLMAASVTIVEGKPAMGIEA
eukprot:scaffold63856_cov29-Prasinocladus_malaysianus.AAC.2